MARLIFNIEDFNDTYQDLLDAVDDAPDINTLIAHIIDDINNLIDITELYMLEEDKPMDKIKLSGLNYMASLIHDAPASISKRMRVMMVALRGVYEVVINNIDSIDTWTFYRYAVEKVRIAGNNHDVLHVDLRSEQICKFPSTEMCHAYIRVFIGVFGALWGSKNLKI